MTSEWSVRLLFVTWPTFNLHLDSESHSHWKNYHTTKQTYLINWSPSEMEHELVSYFVHKRSFPSVPATSDSEMGHMCPADLDKLRYSTLRLMQQFSCFRRGGITWHTAVQLITFVVLIKHCRFWVPFMNNSFHMLTPYIPLKVIGN